MSEPKFTPGPWTGKVNPNGGDMDVQGLDKKCVIGGCGCCESPYTDGDYAQGNLDLILAAPDMFAALKAIVNSDMAMREEDEGRKSPELNAAREAIAQAEGERSEQA